jgi:hypothetical protein
MHDTDCLMCRTMASDARRLEETSDALCLLGAAAEALLAGLPTAAAQARQALASTVHLRRSR